MTKQLKFNISVSTFKMAWKDCHENYNKMKFLNFKCNFIFKLPFKRLILPIQMNQSTQISWKIWT
jgi:hypothetical protein